MSLTTQMLRGTLALLLLLMFALLALAASRTPAQALVRIEPASLPAHVCQVEIARNHALLLAQVPADLNSPGRWRQSCRT